MPNRRAISFSIIVILFLAFFSGTVSSQPIFWKISSKKATVYVLGSIHLADKTFYPLPDYIEKAYDESSALVVELDPGSYSAEGLIGHCSYKDNSDLSQHISKESLAKVKKAFAEINIPNFMWSQMKPFAVSLIYSGFRYMNLGIFPEYGIDQHFLEKARADKKSIIELEKIMDQLNLFDSLPDKQSEMILLKALEEGDSMKVTMKALMTAWKTGDEKELLRLLDQEDGNTEIDTIYREIILDRRNDKMITKIDGLLQTKGTYFVVVGAAHVIGDKGIVTAMKHKKYKTERIK
jgi:uncharacterized protein YbaP (TraB family)